ncbi:hypothetical protein HQ40_07095 [Porphyromonas gulae]|uniref:TssN family type VI secretion system protein n=1 Tax=Porphyromonas gulae TaxID=111105 RepID=UPI00036AC421|nr:TssN family type VI secretion system protein [Porphyromonas gulae]KGN69351.1 hypothetical protein HR09_04170 [Porphyromonas gulae]KGN75119.1 hypothetical protein HQ40_07095 [Porphyromonas gulae]KGN81150.1 hypothetical protein HR13_01950 [Porphyromonas gulae]KGO03503.1 hypothetical protein HQ42_00180 [Porphyromonas gulae]
MNPAVVKIFSTYLLAPIIAFVLGFVVLLVAQKNKLLGDKKAIFYILLSSVLLAIPGLLGFLRVNFMPYGYLLLQGVYLALGYVNSSLLLKYVKPLNGRPFGFAFLFIGVQIIIGLALFSILFNFTNDFHYGIWAGTCITTFAIVPLFSQAFNSYLSIPIEIYKMRIYTPNNVIRVSAPIDTEELLVCEIEIYKNPTDRKPIRLKAKAKQDMIFGDWFELIISDYNQKKVADPIEYYDIEDPYGWIFYVKPSFFRPRKYIDPEISFVGNKVVEKYLIVSKRVRKNEYQ